MSWFLRVFLICFSTAAAGQYPYEFFNSKYFWERIVPEEQAVPVPQLAPTDTAIVLVSIRESLSEGYRYMAESANPDSLRYFFVYSNNGKWMLRETQGLSEAVSYMPRRNNDWVVYTEGMGKVFPANVDRGMQLAAQYDVNVLFYDYPSIRSDYKPYKNYRFALHGSRKAHEGFMPLIDSIRALRLTGAMGSGKLSLFFHSMGNNVLRELALQKELTKYNDRIWVDNLILNAPCVPRRKHTQWMGRIHFARKTYIHYNPDDGALKWARLAGFRQILGEHAKKPLSPQVAYINFNRLCGRGHTNFLEFKGYSRVEEEAHAHYRKVLHGDTVVLDNTAMYAPTEYRGVGWDILPAERENIRVDASGL
jgi:hypothetical protein